MWLNHKQITSSSINAYQLSLSNSCPNHLVIDGLFNESKLDAVMAILQKDVGWQTQRHSYSELYVDCDQWQHVSDDQRFVQRDVWQRPEEDNNAALAFLKYLRSDEFMALLSRIFEVTLTDINVENADINSNYFRLGSNDFVQQHADDSPGREVCMLLYLNKGWRDGMGGELRFLGDGNSIKIAPLYNRCVLFIPASKGSEHWVQALKSGAAGDYRYNLTSWYWSE